LGLFYACLSADAVKSPVFYGAIQGTKAAPLILDRLFRTFKILPARVAESLVISLFNGFSKFRLSFGLLEIA